MAKKVWISLPLLTTGDVKDESVVGFLKGGAKKELEVEVATFITKWLMDRSVPFAIDFDGATVDRTAVMDALPRRLQRALGYKVGGNAEATAEQGTAEPGTTEQVTAEVAEVAAGGEVIAIDAGQTPEPAENPFADAGEETGGEENAGMTDGDQTAE